MRWAADSSTDLRDRRNPTSTELPFVVKIPIGNLAEAPDNLIDDSFDKTKRNRADRGHLYSRWRGDGAVASRSIGKSRQERFD